MHVWHMTIIVFDASQPRPAVYMAKRPHRCMHLSLCPKDTLQLPSPYLKSLLYLASLTLDTHVLGDLGNLQKSFHLSNFWCTGFERFISKIKHLLFIILSISASFRWYKCDFALLWSFFLLTDTSQNKKKYHQKTLDLFQSTHWTLLNFFKTIQTSLDLFGPNWTSVDKFGPLWTSVDLYRPLCPMWTSLNNIRPLWTPLNFQSFI